MIQQIILITDGCSNVGMDPALAAGHANEEGITVNVIGVMDESRDGLQGSKEIREIARAGGGLSRVVDCEQLSHTVQMMTRKTVATTIHQVVQKELQQIMGSSTTVEELPPERREKIVQVIDDMGEEASMRVALLIDTSASMKPKLRAVEEAIRDLMLSLEARRGRSQLSVLHFPGAGGKDCDLALGWTNDLAKIRKLFYNLNMKGATPTGPALMHAVRFMTEGAGDEGVLNDYVV